MKIDIYCVEGSPTGVTPQKIHTRGVGGAEQALLTFAPQMTKRGHGVKIFNDPVPPGLHEGVDFLPRSAFHAKADRDVLIVFRGPTKHLTDRIGEGQRIAPVQVFWSCDQYTAGDYDKDVFPFVDKIVTMSPYHTQYFLDNYKNAPVEKITHIDIGVRTWEYEQPTEKVPYQMIWCSVPSRGLQYLADIWREIIKKVPKATLVITGDFRLWGAPLARDLQFRTKLEGLPGIRYFGKVPRAKLVKLQLESEIMFYPGDYEELFCIACAECQVAGAIPITSGAGALPTTNQSGLGKVIFGHPRVQRDEFVGEVVSLLDEHVNLRDDQARMQLYARGRFNWDKICSEWEKVLA